MKMSEQNFKKYLDTLHDFGGIDPFRVVNGIGSAGLRQKKIMKERLTNLEKKYGSVSGLMYKRAAENRAAHEDCGRYLMIMGYYDEDYDKNGAVKSRTQGHGKR